MTPQDVARLEACRTSCLAAVTSAQAALMTVEAMLLTDDREQSRPDAPDWGTFDTEPQQEPTYDGREKASRRR